MDLLSKILGLAGGIPWVKVGIFGIIISGVLYSVHILKLSGEQSEIIKQLQAETQMQKKQDAAAIQSLKDQYARDLLSLNKERDDALQIARATQEELDNIKNVSPNKDGVTRPIIVDTLSWMRDYNTRNRDTNTESKPTSGANNSHNPAGSP